MGIGDNAVCLARAAAILWFYMEVDYVSVVSVSVEFFGLGCHNRTYFVILETRILRFPLIFHFLRPERVFMIDLYNVIIPFWHWHYHFFHLQTRPQKLLPVAFLRTPSYRPESRISLSGYL
jgi:hypothetical protein